jgi:hypothetical protein
MTPVVWTVFFCEFVRKLIGRVKLPRLLTFSFSGDTSIRLAGRSRRSLACVSGATCRNERSDILLPRRSRPGRLRLGRLPELDGRPSRDVCEECRFRAVAAAAADRLDWAELLRESIALEAANVAGFVFYEIIRKSLGGGNVPSSYANLQTGGYLVGMKRMFVGDDGRTMTRLLPEGEGRG